MLYTVSCSSATACTAVGEYDASSGYMTLVESWNGTTWSIQPSPNPTEAESSSLKGVSCTSATVCTAVGWSRSEENLTMLAERWNGAEWSIQSTPTASGDALSRISCTTTSCIAVGEDSSGRAVAASWNGAEWSIQKTVTPTGTEETALFDVSCTSASSCTAVGAYSNPSGARVTLAEHWDGTAWSLQMAPNPGGSLSSGLDGVSCASVVSCAAVGHYEPKKFTSVTLAERYSE